jgi:hypothetical protein
VFGLAWGHQTYLLLPPFFKKENIYISIHAQSLGRLAPDAPEPDPRRGCDEGDDREHDREHLGDQREEARAEHVEHGLGGRDLDRRVQGIPVYITSHQFIVVVVVVFDIKVSG